MFPRLSLNKELSSCEPIRKRPAFGTRFAGISVDPAPLADISLLIGRQRVT
jgi:hypothetical protein